MNDKINSDIDEIVKYATAKLNSIEAIFLVGGFGRDEGSLLIHEGNTHVINDYDLVIIASESYKQNTINTLRKELENKLSIRQVDITIYNKQQLRNMGFTMYSYDLKHASKTIFGSKKILDLMPNMDKTRMPTFEAVRPLLLFPVSLLQAQPRSSCLSDIDLFWSYQQISKSILGWSTAMLIDKGLYDPLYSKRSELFLETFPDKEYLCKLVKKATSFKLQPVFEPISKNKIDEFWVQATKAHLEVAEMLLCKFYSTRKTTLEDFSWAYKNSLRNIIKYIFSFISNIDRTTMIHIELGQLFLCKSLTSEDHAESKKFFNLAKKEANHITRKPSFLDEENLTDFFLSTNPNSKNWHKKGNKLSY